MNWLGRSSPTLVGYEELVTNLLLVGDLRADRLRKIVEEIEVLQLALPHLADTVELHRRKELSDIHTCARERSLQVDLAIQVIVKRREPSQEGIDLDAVR